MDGQRFDRLAKTLAGRLSRRHALRRVGAAASASLLTASGLRPDAAAALIRAQGDGQPLYTIIRRYTLSTPTGQVRKALQQGYVDDACNAPGFVAYLTVEDEDGDFATVAVFRTQVDLQNFANAEATWIAQNLGNLLPAPDEAISGDTYIHAITPQPFANSCSAAPAPTPAAPTTIAPTNAPPTATAVPSSPTPTPAPACRDQGCVCATGTRNPCKGDLVCCPTTDLMGGPGICQPQSVCHPNQCPANGDPCPDTCSANDVCPGCCSGYCNASSQCDDTPAPPCTSQGCDCNGGVQNACDDGLVCCQGGQPIPGGAGTCQPEDQCTPPPCTSEGCACNGGVQGNCDDGLVCCQGGQSIPGGAGTCVAESGCAPPPCTGQGCDCNGGVQGACDDGLVCCQADGSVPGGPGTCQPADSCGPPPCTDNGGGCDATCNWGDGCAGCCSGYCNDTGQCDDAPAPPCSGEGCTCITGTESPCDDGLSCCGSGDVPGGPGVCQASC
jgi:cell division septation protein DedD